MYCVGALRGAPSVTVFVCLSFRSLCLIVQADGVAGWAKKSSRPTGRLPNYMQFSVWLELLYFLLISGDVYNGNRYFHGGSNAVPSVIGGSGFSPHHSIS